jgi:hypothetical protein
MCAGESARDSLSRDTVRLGLAVADVDVAAADVSSGARATFGTAFADTVAQALGVSPDDIVIETVTAAPSSGTLRRWLQDLVDAAVSFTITTDSAATAALLTKIHELRNASAMTINVGDASTADTTTFTQPAVVARDDPAVIKCREGHDPDSPLCRVCLDGAQKHHVYVLEWSRRGCVTWINNVFVSVFSCLSLHQAIWKVATRAASSATWSRSPGSGWSAWPWVSWWFVCL